MTFNKLSLEEKFGQMILLGLDVYDINDEIINIIKEYKIGGVILYKKNYTSIPNMIEVINKLKKINEGNNIPLFIAIDQENGRVNRFPKDILRIVSPLKQAKLDNINIVNEINDITVNILKSVGVNLNFAPVIDIVKNEKNKVIGNRSYGNNKETVLKYAIPFMKTMQNNNIISVVKHFPGHGFTNMDTHFVIPIIKDNENINIFKDAILNGADAIMVDHIRVSGYGYLPASLNSKIINTLLINKYNYNGLIVADDLRMNYFSKLYGIKRSIIKSINAGNNLIILKYKKNDSKRIYKRLFKMVSNCEIDPEIIDKSAKKVISYKDKYNVNNDIINTNLDIVSINNRIKIINDLFER